MRSTPRDILPQSTCTRIPSRRIRRPPCRRRSSLVLSGNPRTRSYDILTCINKSIDKRSTNHGMHGIYGNEVIDRFLFCVVRVFCGSFPYVHYTALCKPFAAARQPLPAGASRLFATALPLPFPPNTPPTADTHPSGADPDSSAPCP
ncbi:hypothetical protein SDC9_171026 [bioreactor metagenome]|uniref:Uncharacterized protein n=1 Tax=bioreactor metagenome TaxID=1076179 RepID=A0A645GIT3_9ZZZZ